MKKKQKHKKLFEYYFPPAYSQAAIGLGKTVSTIQDDPFYWKEKRYYYQSDLTLEEAFDIALYRTLKSSSTTNFYDELNWHLNRLGQETLKVAAIKSILLKKFKKNI